MPDPGELFLDAYFKMHAQRTQAQQFAQDFQLRQAGQEIQRQQLASEAGFRDAQVANMQSDNVRQDKQLQQNAGIADRNYAVNVAQLFDAQKGQLVAPGQGQQVPGALGVSQQMTTPGSTIALPGVGLYHPYTAEEQTRQHIASQQLETDLKRKQSYQDLNDFLDYTKKSTGIEFDPATRSLVNAQMLPGGGKDLVTALMEQQKTPKATPGEVYAQAITANHQHILDAAKANPALLHDPKFLEKAGKADKALQEGLLDWQRAGAQVSVQPGMGALADKEKVTQDFKKLSQALGTQNFASDPEKFRQALTKEVQSGNYSPEAVKQFIDTQTAHQPDKPKTIQEILVDQMLQGMKPK